jgi:hypothetical protein
MGQVGVGLCIPDPCVAYVFRLMENFLTTPRSLVKTRYLTHTHSLSLFHTHTYTLPLIHSFPTECFTDFGKLNFPMADQFYARANLQQLPQLHLKNMLNLKVVKIDSKNNHLA